MIFLLEGLLELFLKLYVLQFRELNFLFKLKIKIKNLNVIINILALLIVLKILLDMMVYCHYGEVMESM